MYAIAYAPQALNNGTYSGEKGKKTAEVCNEPSQVNAVKNAKTSSRPERKPPHEHKYS
jgi:hypothetical protein